MSQHDEDIAWWVGVGMVVGICICALMVLLGRSAEAKPNWFCEEVNEKYICGRIK